MGLGTEERGVIDFLTGGGATGARMRAFDWSIAQRISGAFAEGSRETRRCALAGIRNWATLARLASL